MNQLLLGAMLPFLIAAALYRRRGGRASLTMLILTPLCMAFSALWAVAPDIPRLLGLSGLYERLAVDPRMNIFFWHYTIDRIEVDTFPYHAGLLLMFLALMAAAWRELYLAERE